LNRKITRVGSPKRESASEYQALEQILATDEHGMVNILTVFVRGVNALSDPRHRRL